ncbi:MAG: DUF721 domain-containing protein [Bacteroidota bacterium]
MKRDNDQSLKQVITQMLKAYGLQDKLHETEIINAWRTQFGKVVNNHTTDLYIKGKTLFAHIDSPSLRQELFYNRTKMVEVLNNEVGHEVIVEIILK